MAKQSCCDTPLQRTILMYIVDFEDNGIISRDDIDYFIEMCRNLNCDSHLQNLLNELEEIVFNQYNLPIIDLFIHKHNMFSKIRILC